MSIPTAPSHLASPPHPAGTGTALNPTTPTSLIDPIPGHPDADVPGQLHLFAQMPGMQDAVKAIFLLMDGEPVPSTIDNASCQKAAGVLLELGQGRLLCRLAEERPIDYPLHMGSPSHRDLLLNSEQRARLLADISASWPLHTPVSLGLSNALSIDTLRALHPFLKRPLTLKVNLELYDAADAAPAHALAAALQLRRLSALSLHCNAPVPQALKALRHVQTEAISIQIANPTQKGPLNECESELFELVLASGARKLDVAHASVRAFLAERLLNCSSHWTSVHLRLEQEVSFRLIDNKSGKLKIDQVSVHAQPVMLALNVPTLKMLGYAGVHALTVHGALDLNTLDASLSATASTPTCHLTHIEACCMVRESADAQQTQDLLKRIGQGRTVSHRPMPIAVSAYRAITATEAARLAATGSSNSSMALAVGNALSPEQAPGAAQLQAIQEIGLRLLPQYPVEGLVQYLSAQDNAGKPRPERQEMPEDPPAFDMWHKLQALKTFKRPDALIRQALGTMLRSVPPEIASDLMQVALHALRVTGFPMQKRDKPADWYELGRTMSKPWVSGGMHAADAVTVAQVDALKHPQRSDANPNTTTTTTTTTTTNSTRSADLSVKADPDDDVVTFMSYVHPNTAAGLRRLKTAMQAAANRARTLPDQPAVLAALWILNQLEGHPSGNLVSLSPEEQQTVARLLLDHGQGPLFHHLAPTLPHWKIRVRTEEIARTLEAMASWSDLTPRSGQAIGLHLVLPAGLPPQAIQAVAKLAQTTEPGHLQLTVEVDARTPPAIWGALEALVRACPTSMLAIEQAIHPPTPLDPLIDFLTRVEQAHLVELKLSGMGENDETVLMRLSTAVEKLSATKLWVGSSRDGVLKALATCKPWSCLTFTASPSAAKELRNQTIVVPTLSLSLPHPPIAHDQIVTIVRACKGLRVLELWGARPDLDDVAHILDDSRSITTLMCDPSAVSEVAAQRAMALLRQNTFLRQFLPPSRPPRPGTGLAITQATRIQVLELTARNQLLSEPDIRTRAEEFAIGAVRGLARTRALDHFNDLSVIIAGMLDGRSAQSLSVVNKATFAGSRETWEFRIRGLAKHFELGVTGAQAMALVGSWSKAQTWVQQKVKALRQQGLPDAVIGEVLRHRLRQLVPPPGIESAPNATPPTPQELDTIPHLLQAMFDLGAIPAQVWLKEVMGIDV